MARPIRFVVPGLPHHVTQRGNYKQKTFFDEKDYSLYLRLLRDHSKHFEVAILGYCLMPNHTHLILVPPKADSLSRLMQRLHADYARCIHLQYGQMGHLWQARYYSAPMDEHHFWQAMVYVEQNPERAKLVKDCWEWPWSSAAAHLSESGTDLLDLKLWNQQFTGESWREYLKLGVTNADILQRIRESTVSGWPIGSQDFLAELEKALGRPVQPRAAGRPFQVARAG